MDILEFVGKKIRFYRQQKSLTQKDLGKNFGVHGNSVSRWENGQCSPTLKDLEKLAKELDIDIREFFPASTKLYVPSKALDDFIKYATRGIEKENKDDLSLAQKQQIKRVYDGWDQGILEEIK